MLCLFVLLAEVSQGSSECQLRKNEEWFCFFHHC